VIQCHDGESYFSSTPSFGPPPHLPHLRPCLPERKPWHGGPNNMPPLPQNRSKNTAPTGHSWRDRVSDGSSSARGLSLRVGELEEAEGPICKLRWSIEVRRVLEPPELRSPRTPASTSFTSCGERNDRIPTARMIAAQPGVYWLRNRKNS
jgi:hypothetical protein